MKTIQLTDALAKRLIADLADKWAKAATLAALDVTARTWNSPARPSDRDVRKWSARHAADAAAYSKMLWAFGIETPEIDVSAYVVPVRDGYSPSAKPGDLVFRSRDWMTTCDALAKAIQGGAP